MLISDKVTVSWNPANRTNYESKGYIFTKYKDTFEVSVNDLSNGSNVMVDVKCDYCDTIIPKPYKRFLKERKNINKDCCENCNYLKTMEVNLLIYGVKSTASLPNVRQKMIETTRKNFGCDYNLSSPEIRERIKQTNINKYGGSTPSKNKEILEKQIKTLYENGTQKCSKQQKYLHGILGGELNFPQNNSSLDIAFINEKIYLEYHGGGHWLTIKFEDITENEFKQKERNRWYALFRKGWKSIEIISKKDLLPQDVKIKELLTFAKEYLNSGHSWIKFDIDNSQIICSQYSKEYDFGKLRKIKKSDIA